MPQLGAQVTQTDPATDNAYLITQLEMDATGHYVGTGGVIWVDRALPHPDDRMRQAVLDCLAMKFSGHRKR
jgi:hypothetical protein